MTYTLTVRREAEFDIDEQYTAYEDKRVGLGHDFVLCIEEALDKLLRNPLIYRKFHQNLRRVSLRRFPYRVMYFVTGQKSLSRRFFMYAKIRAL
ncbi:type II toxin-antitoxin system RelE/ParE family toxin [Pseudohongiella sp.]|uniref:type II toxin-antitoxin system RelE/ParE family toxin n=1 Tax=Pseudohongiella sp. TaxID=1979412 RepID=UPI00349FE82A